MDDSLNDIMAAESASTLPLASSRALQVATAKRESFAKPGQVKRNRGTRVKSGNVADADATPQQVRKRPRVLPPMSTPQRALYEHPPQEATIKDFHIGDPLGEGKFGRVYVARTKLGGRVVALKILNKEMILKHNMHWQIMLEMRIALHLKHPHIADTYGWFQDDKKIYYLMEYCEHGDLFGITRKHRQLSHPLVAKYTSNLLDALAYCHAKTILHRDIKPENILIASNNQLKLADWGWATFLPEDASRKGGLGPRKTRCGTTEYMGPELLENRPYSTEVDVWAVGILVYELLVGASPFVGASDRMTEQRILVGSLRWPAPDKINIPREAKDFVQQILCRSQSRRPTIVELQSHPFLRNNYERNTMLDQFLVRLGAPAVGPLRPDPGRTVPRLPAPARASEKPSA